MTEQLFDIAVCLLLLVTIVHLALVQRRLRAFRAERDRLQAFVTALDFTVERAETAIRRLRAIDQKTPNATTEAPRPVRTRDPEDLLRAARRAARVEGKPAQPMTGATAEPSPPSARAEDALQQTLGA